jgi:hypothetical protein
MHKLVLAVIGWAIALMVVAGAVVSAFVPVANQTTTLAIIEGCVILGAGLATVFLRRLRERIAGAEATGIQLALAVRAQSRVMIDALVAALILGCVLLYLPSFPAALGDFWVRFAILRGRNNRRETESPNAVAS